MSIKEIVGSGARTFFFAQVCVFVASPLDNGRGKKEGTPYGYKSVFFKLVGKNGMGLTPFVIIMGGGKRIRLPVLRRFKKQLPMDGGNGQE